MPIQANDMRGSNECSHVQLDLSTPSSLNNPLRWVFRPRHHSTFQIHKQIPPSRLFFIPDTCVVLDVAIFFTVSTLCSLPRTPKTGTDIIIESCEFIEKGCKTSGPRATSGPRRVVMWPATSNRNMTNLDTALTLNPQKGTTLIPQHLNGLNLEVQGENRLGYHLVIIFSAFKAKPILALQRVYREVLFTFILSG